VPRLIGPAGSRSACAGRPQRVRRRRYVIGHAQLRAAARGGAAGDPAGSVGRLIARELKGYEPKCPFQYFGKDNIAVVGKNFGFLESGRPCMSGFVTWLVWAVLHVMSLPQPQNKWRVRTQWGLVPFHRAAQLAIDSPADPLSLGASSELADRLQFGGPFFGEGTQLIYRRFLIRGAPDAKLLD
jgi:hypothetical protein